MKITEKNLQRIIQEETDQVLLEVGWSGDTIVQSIANHEGIKFKREQGPMLKQLVAQISSMFHTPAARKQFFRWYSDVYDSPEVLRRAGRS